MRLGARLAGLLGSRRGTRDVGRRGERVAARHLRGLGYRVVERNVELGRGELDLVCLAPDGETIVVVEVKARLLVAGGGAFRPENAITGHKRAKLRSLTQSLRRARGWLERPIRIDVVAVEFRDGARPVVRHYPGAV
ncbi:MAG: YraN family protein [Phycisphaerales bacterium JB040]